MSPVPFPRVPRKSDGECCCIAPPTTCSCPDDFGGPWPDQILLRYNMTAVRETSGGDPEYCGPIMPSTAGGAWESEIIYSGAEYELARMAAWDCALPTSAPWDFYSENYWNLDGALANTITDDAGIDFDYYRLTVVRKCLFSTSYDNCPDSVFVDAILTYWSATPPTARPFTKVEQPWGVVFVSGRADETVFTTTTPTGKHAPAIWMYGFDGDLDAADIPAGLGCVGWKTSNVATSSCTGEVRGDDMRLGLAVGSADLASGDFATGDCRAYCLDKLADGIGATGVARTAGQFLKASFSTSITIETVP